MLKGINRQIIEVTHTNSPYFERALLFVRPSCGETDADELDRQARRLVVMARTYPFLKRGRRKAVMIRIAVVILSGIGGLLLGRWITF